MSDPYPDEPPADDHNVDEEFLEEIDRLENEDEEDE